jgi:hypothetical protein
MTVCYSTSIDRVFSCSRDEDHFVADDSCRAATPVLYFVYSICSDIFLWIPTTDADGDTVSCLGGGDDTAWLFCSEYSVSPWDEIARGLHARSYDGFYFCCDDKFAVPYRD